ncbi:centrin, putative [Plasmodium ovale]|uniref:Centrin, putative n=1 Tax=Plasmodium ovale TaxID=36330 RepID=A0A1C3KM69_PLAOA|nr:centrin, putative [Plasmodium ovale]
MRLSSLKLLFYPILFVTLLHTLKSQKNDKDVDVSSQVPNQMSDEEKEEVHFEFAEYDLNRDGFIDAEEITRVLKNMKKEDFISFFTRVDLDSSGTISLKEYIHFINTN